MTDPFLSCRLFIAVGTKGKPPKPSVAVEVNASDSDNESVVSGHSSGSSTLQANEHNEVDESSALENYEDRIKECIDGLLHKRYVSTKESSIHDILVTLFTREF